MSNKVPKKFDIHDDNADLFGNNFQEELTIRAEMLRQTGYLNSADWCEHIRDNINLYSKHPNDFTKDLRYFLESFKTDFLDRVDTGDRNLRRDCFEIVQVLLEQAIRENNDFDKALTKLLFFNDRSLAANKPIYKMDEAFNCLADGLLEVKVYGYLCTFMMHVDGQYFPAVRILCGLKLASENRDFTIDYLESLNLDQMQKIIGDFGSPIFAVYSSVGRHLRNAIAHCNFSYNSGKLTCWDIDPKTKQEVWRKDFTLAELMAVINDLKSVEFSFTTWFVVRFVAERMSKYIGHIGLDVRLHFATSSK